MIHIALLRSINVGGRNQIAMSDLRDLFSTLGFPDARSLLQSGNVIFSSKGRTSAELERVLEVETERRLKVRVDYFVRTSHEWKKVIARNPFPREAQDDPSHLVVMFLRRAPEEASVKALQAAMRGPESVRAAGQQAYITYPAGIGKSKLTTAVLEDKLGSRGTGRNWNTILKLQALLHADGD